MDYETIENRYLADNKFYNQLIGVWPGQERPNKYIVRSFIFVVMMLTNIAQISQIIVFFSIDTVTDQLLFLMLALGLFCKQYNYILNEDKLKVLFDGIVRDRMIERPQEEFDILEEHSRKAMLLTNIYKVTAYAGVVLFLLLPTVPQILNIIAPLNVSRERVTVYPSYYFVDTQEYYYPIVAHMVLCCFSVCIVYIACDINLVHVVLHACALLAISGYRFKHAMDEADCLAEKFTDEMMEKSYEKVIQAIKSHKRAEQYVKDVNICHLYYLAIGMGMITVAFTATLVKVTSLEMGMPLITFSVFTVCEVIHVAFLTVTGQFAADKSDEVFQKICEARWYNGSVRTQGLYAFALRKCLTPHKLTAGGLFPLNLDILVKILKASFSYYTVLKST